MIFLIDSMVWFGFTMAYLPVTCLIGSVPLFTYGSWRKRNKLPRLQTFHLAGVMLFLPVALAVFLLVAGALGIEPVPN